MHYQRRIARAWGIAPLKISHSWISALHALCLCRRWREKAMFSMANQVSEITIEENKVTKKICPNAHVFQLIYYSLILSKYFLVLSPVYHSNRFCNPVRKSSVELLESHRHKAEYIFTSKTYMHKNLALQMTKNIEILKNITSKY